MRTGTLCAIAVMLSGLAVGCGSEDTDTSGRSTNDASNILGTALDRVDAAVVSDDPDRITAAVDALRRLTDAAVADGDLDPDRADDIDTAARDLLNAMPLPAPAPTPAAPTRRPRSEKVHHHTGHGHTKTPGPKKHRK